MNGLKKCLLLSFALLIHFFVSAQDLVKTFLDKQGKDDNLEVISIGKKMLEMMSDLSSGNPELKEAIKGLDNIHIVTSKDSILNKEYYDFAWDLLGKSKGFEPILLLNEGDEDVIVMIRSVKGIITELVLLSDKGAGFNLISLSGNIDLNTLSKYSESLNIKGLNDLSPIGSKK
jgi:hypothetical protein